MSRTREAFAGLLETLRRIDAAEPWLASDGSRMVYDPQFAADNALAAWSKRGRLRDDQELRTWVAREICAPVGDAGLDVILDHVEAHLFGQPSEEGGERGR